jgi:hypothetical protein
MASNILSSFNSPRFQLFATAAVSATSAVVLLLGYQALAREERIHDLKASVPSLDEPHDVKRVSHRVRPLTHRMNLTSPLAEQLWGLICHP